MPIGEVKAGIRQAAQVVTEEAAGHIKAAIEAMQEGRNRLLQVTYGTGQSDVDTATGYMQATIDDLENALTRAYGHGAEMEDIAARL